MRELTEAMAARAGMRASGPYERVIEAVRAAPEEQLPPLVEQLRRGVADLEGVVDALPSVAASDTTDADTVVRPRETEYDEWVRRELGSEGGDPPGLTVL